MKIVPKILFAVALCWVMALSGCAGGCGGDEKVQSPYAHFIAFTGEDKDGPGVFQTGPEFTSIQRLASISAPNDSVQISPDRSKILFIDGNSIKVMSASGGVTGDRAVGLSPHYATWAADSDRIIYSSGLGGIRAAKYSDSSFTQTIAATGSYPYTSRDGKQVVFADQNKLMACNPDGSNTQTLFAGAAGEIVFSPSAIVGFDKVTFMITANDLSNKRIMLYDQVTSTSSVLAQGVEYDINFPFPLCIVPAPVNDFGWLACEVTRDASGMLSSTMRACFSAMPDKAIYTSNVLPGERPVVSPDFEKILLNSNTGLIIMNADGTNATAVGDAYKAYCPDWR